MIALTDSQAAEALDLLNAEFNRAVTFHPVRGHGKAWPMTQQIGWGPRVGGAFGVRPVEYVLHEFAHCLCRVGEGHGRGFFAALVDVIWAWYGAGQEFRYCWDLEYARIRAWAGAAGHCPPVISKRRVRRYGYEATGNTYRATCHVRDTL